MLEVGKLINLAFLSWPAVTSRSSLGCQDREVKTDLNSFYFKKFLLVVVTCVRIFQFVEFKMILFEQRGFLTKNTSIGL